MELYLYAIDEARLFFGNHLRGDKNVFHFFSWHRHHGFDVFLIGQTRDQLHKNIRDLVIFEYRAANKVINVLPGFRMNIYIEGMYTGFKVVRPREEIFQLYKSFDVPEMEKPKNPFIRYFIILGCIFCILLASLYYSFSYKPRMIAAQKAEAEQLTAVQHTASVPHSSSASPQSGRTADSSGSRTAMRQEDEPVLRRFYLGTVKVGASVSVVHPYENELYSIKSFPHPVYFDRDRKKFFCKIPQDEYELWRGAVEPDHARRAIAQGHGQVPQPRQGSLPSGAGFDL